MFAAAGVTPTIERQVVHFEFESVDDAVEQYADNFGPVVTARAALEPRGRWEEFVSAFRDLVTRSNVAEDGTGRIPSDYFLILVQR